MKDSPAIPLLVAIVLAAVAFGGLGLTPSERLIAAAGSALAVGAAALVVWQRRLR